MSYEEQWFCTGAKLLSTNLHQLNCSPQLALVVVNIALSSGQVLVTSKHLHHPCIYPLVAKLSQKLPASAVTACALQSCFPVKAPKQVNHCLCAEPATLCAKEQRQGWLFDVLAVLLSVNS